MKVKREIRIIGWDDSAFDFSNNTTFIIGVIFRAGVWMDGVIFKEIHIDGFDVTEKIIEAVLETKHYDQLRLIMLSGITFGGFNVADIKEISKETELPVVVIIRNMPDIEAMKRALSKMEGYEIRLKALKNAGKIFPIEINNKIIKKKGIIYYQLYNIKRREAEEIIRLTCVHSLIPEPLRIAHIIGSGLSSVVK
ncbi:MAG TPA: DUF99 family protein [Candidatus Aenigmarchaeota archaeon]|nr:DUF99 family protein [Candidatus Aenigmarchaeota archaeon]